MDHQAGGRGASIADKVLSYLGNGFVLLLVGSLITSFLVPRFQRAYEERKHRMEQRQQCLEHFLLYTNSIWHEYYALVPLTQKVEIDGQEYLTALKEITQIKLKRYEAYARVRALSLSYRDVATEASKVEKAIDDYAVKVNEVSTQMNSWLRNLYCTPTARNKSPCAEFDLRFDPFSGYQQLQASVMDIGNQGGDEVAALMVQSMNTSP